MSWASSVDSAKSTASGKKEAYALYFCAEQYSEVVGEGATALNAFKKSNSGKGPPANIFDNNVVVDALKKAGINQLAKVPVTKDNADLCKKYGAGANTLVICAPNGEKLAMFAGADCTQSAVTKALKTFKTDYAAYAAKQK
ncbi:MAG TPA: hypothetical protein VEJ63_11095 [Planctomycetota bacterium]|nr:hypothetical protein [Planctomycetota bacterium]